MPAGALDNQGVKNQRVKNQGAQKITRRKNPATRPAGAV